MSQVISSTSSFPGVPHSISHIFTFVVQKDTTSLTTENSELKLRLQSMEQQAQLRDGMQRIL